MSAEKVKLKRLSARNTSFDLNRSSPQVKEKYLRNNQGIRMPPPMDNSMVDLSQTINAHKSKGAIPKDRVEKKGDRVDDQEELPHSIKTMVSDSVEDMRRALDHSIRDMINDSVNRQLSKVNNSIALLSDAVRSLSLNNQSRGCGNLPVGDVDIQGAQTARLSPRVHSGREPSTAAYREPIVPSASNEYPVHHYGNRARVERFGLKFDGNEAHLPVESFVFRLEHCQRHYQIPWHEILGDFHLLVSGQPLDWYWLYVETTQVTSWESLRHALLNRFRTHRTNLDIMHELVERRQKPGESINDYFYHLNLLRSKLEQPISEFEIIKLAKRNLREGIGRVVYPISVSSLEQLRIECVEAERNFSRRDERNGPTHLNKRNLHEIQFSPDEEVIDVDEIKADAICWNCQESGHIFIDCPSEQRKLFCYKCGKANTITPKCQNCKSRGNIKRGVIMTGESRPSQTTPNH